MFFKSVRQLIYEGLVGFEKSKNMKRKKEGERKRKKGKCMKYDRMSVIQVFCFFLGYFGEARNFIMDT
jgi:hypothetical protein